MSKKKTMDDWFDEHLEISFVGGDKKDNKKTAKIMVKQVKEQLMNEDIILGTDFSDTSRLLDELVEDAKEIVKKRKKENENE